MATEHEVVYQHEHGHEHEHEHGHEHGHGHKEFVSTSSFRIIPTIDEHSSGVAEDQIEITFFFIQLEIDEIISFYLKKKALKRGDPDPNSCSFAEKDPDLDFLEPDSYFCLFGTH